jgi:N-acylglucosamine 2-epimerase
MTSNSIDSRNDELIACYRDGLLKSTLPFWIPRAVDRKHGGFFTALDRDGSLLDTDKGIWQQGRFTWLLGRLYNTVEQNPEWLALCQHGVTFLDRYGFDPEDGRMWFHVAADGTPIRKRRYAFSESFAAIAYGEYAKATASSEYAQKAATCFERFVDHCGNPQNVQPKFTSHRELRGIGVPMITIATAQELRRSIAYVKANPLIDEAIATIEKYHVKHDRRVVMEVVERDGSISDHFDGRTLNPGHAIEAAWFILWEAKVRDEPRLVELGCKILDYMWERGWDNKYGGLFYFVDIDGKPVQEYWHDMKFWWPHNEAIIATLLAYQLTGLDRYAEWHALVHNWAHEYFADAEFGEWYGYLHRDGSPSVRLKGNLWKGPFHMPRMQLICWKLLESHRQ